MKLWPFHQHHQHIYLEMDRHWAGMVTADPFTGIVVPGSDKPITQILERCEVTGCGKYRYHIQDGHLSGGHFGPPRYTWQGEGGVGQWKPNILLNIKLNP